MTFGGQRKRQRSATSTSTRLFTTAKPEQPARPDETLTETAQIPSPSHRPITPTPPRFNDSSAADVVLRLHLEPPSPSDLAAGTDGSVEDEDLEFYLHSNVLRRSKYFSALLSDRWQKDSGGDPASLSGQVFYLNLRVSSSQFGSINDHLTVLRLLYTDDFTGSIDSVSSALSILHVALELLFEECVTACVRFIEAVPWNEDEEKKVLSAIPFLREEESRELLARVCPERNDCSEEMLYDLIRTAIDSNIKWIPARSCHQFTAFPKAFVANLLRDFSSRDSVRRVLDRAFGTSLSAVKESLEEYSSPDFRGDDNETEAIQRLNLQKALTNLKHLMWLVERMIELRVADNAVKEWSDQATLSADLRKAFHDDAWNSIVPGLPVLVLRCLHKLADAVATGSILASRQVRMNLVKDWLPVLIVCRDKVFPIQGTYKSLYLDLEQTFLRIISTLPMSDSKDFLQQCLSFSTRNIEDCPHLVSAFKTWFRRATQPPQGLN